MEQDKELKAISEILALLNDLDGESRSSAMKYVLRRLNIDFDKTSTVLNNDNNINLQRESPIAPMNNNIQIDIRALREEKKPNSTIQMAVLLAYYLKEKAPVEERKDYISSEDFQKYFLQANYPLPEGKRGALDTLNNAKKSGYFDSLEAGKFKLNAVGYNLAAFKMGSEDLPKRIKRNKSKKTGTKKPVAKKSKTRKK